jgi:hypothetical protein
MPPDRKPLRCGLILKIKPPADGQPERFKARLVAYGNHQKEGTDYIWDEIFAPVIKYKTLRLTCALAAEFDLHLHKLDVKTAFLHGDLEEEIYLEPPPGTRAPYGKSGCKWKLKKTLYGLKQSPRKWNEKLHKFLISLGFTRLESDYGLYAKISGNALELVTVYVDDLLVAAKSLESVQKTKSAFTKKFEMADFGPVQTILGISLHRDWQKGTIVLEQGSYVATLLEKFRQTKSQYSPTPINKDSIPMSLDHCPVTFVP